MKTCWICLGNDETDANKFVKPCFCQGDMKYIHRFCFIKYFTTNKKCKFCYHSYQVELDNYKFVKFYEFLVIIAKYVIWTASLIFLSLFIFIFLCGYGISVIYLIMGLEYIQNNKYKVIIGSPLIFLSIISGRFIEYNYLFHILPTIIFLDLSKTEHLFISFIPLMFFFSTGNILRMVETNEEYFFDKSEIDLAGAMGIYDNTTDLSREIVMNNNSIPSSKIVVSMLTPYISFLLGYMFHGDTLYKSACGCIVFALGKQILYFYYLLMLKRIIKSIKVIEPGIQR
ncbi:E3 ubiquitin-protein ligase MARCH5 [Dictyocoela muelleri]|nr:E3 ubiquitin-protein ligase MARCH5 [Dictyocoela muelleri]